MTLQLLVGCFFLHKSD